MSGLPDIGYVHVRAEVSQAAQLEIYAVRNIIQAHRFETAFMEDVVASIYHTINEEFNPIHLEVEWKLFLNPASVKM